MMHQQNKDKYNNDRQRKLLDLRCYAARSIVETLGVRRN